MRWDSGGHRLWGYAPPRGVEYIDTVYALNVDDGVAWANYYPGFPLLEARTDGAVRLRSTPVIAPPGAWPCTVTTSRCWEVTGNRTFCTAAA